MKLLNNVGAVILAAGESRRMTKPKPFLRYNSKMRFIDKIIDEYREFGINNIVIVVNNKIFPRLNIDDSISVVLNQHLKYERFYSIKLGLDKFLNRNFCFIQNVDNPFVNQDVLRQLYLNRISDGCTVPVFNELGGHPILLGRKVIKKIAYSESNNINFKELLTEFKSRRVEVNDNSILININTPEDYKKYFN